jgi:hypothetical protein
LYLLDTYSRNDYHQYAVSRILKKETPPSRSSTMASLIAILDLKGKPLIQRSYKDDVPSSYIERFLPLVLDIEEEGQQVTPCFSSQGINYMHIRHSNLYSASSRVQWQNHLSNALRYSPRSIQTQLECR